MKKIAIAVLSLLIMSSVLYAQDTQKMNVVKTDLFSVIIRTGVVKYERALNEHMSVQLGFFYTGFHPRDSQSELNGWGITPEFRFYLSDTPAPAGTYIAPNFRYMKLDVYDGETMQSGTFTNSSLAFNLGKQWLFKNVVTLDAWVGPSYNFRKVSDITGEVDTGIEEANGFGLRIGLALGIAF